VSVDSLETILLVDDEEPLIEVGQDMLLNYGFAVLTADSGERAVEIFKKASKDIDLVILDLGMPGMGGYKCLSEILRMDPGVKVIAVSGYADNGQRRKILDAGASAFLGKPYRISEIMGKVRELLNGGREGRMLAV
jgi:CheY-like chemotaxis protein